MNLKGYHTAKLYLNLKYQTGTLMNLMLLPGILKYLKIDTEPLNTSTLTDMIK